MMQRVLGWVGVVTGAAIGATLAIWASTPYPLSVLERNVLTPVVKPGDSVRVELLVDRRERCLTDVTRFVQEPDGDRQRVVQNIRPDYGRMGRDAFVIKIPTEPDANFGDAEIVSTAEAMCNPWHRWVKPVGSGDPWRDKFKFGPETVNIPGKYEGQYVQ